MNTQQFDALIIGFGKAGKTLAVALANAGKKVALVERSPKMYGGTCINIACIPTKVLVNAAEHHQSFDEAMAHKAAVVTRLNDKNYHMLADRETVSVIEGEASFVDAHTVKVAAGDDELLLTAQQLFINTGAESIIPDIPGVDHPLVYTSTELLERREQPQRLVVIGGGYIGLEFASTYAKLGTEVVILEKGDALLAREDPAIAAAATEALQAQGIKIVFGADVAAIEGDETLARVIERTREMFYGCDAVLLATGRRPATVSLNLSAAGVATDERGAIVVDETLRTSQPHIWAMGDVTGGPQFTYASLDDFRIVKSQLLGDGSYTRAEQKTLPYAVFMQTPLARVGMTEAEARAAGRDIIVKELPAMAIPRLHVDNTTTGLLRAVIDANTERILGASLLCRNSPEVINIIKTVMDNDLPYTVLRDQIFTHPTVSEALNDLFA
ncbi:MAG: FAD-dependent oxidoreductase [Candidatus Saccharibacteria bacterium]|nr:FAD-dependent oxidoreductase [Candidatus Saccharibacteria bacterium]